MILFIILFAMIFCHIVDDYYLQGILASMKQKRWWVENCPDKKYQNDFYIALIEHAFSWAFSIHIPLICFILYNDIKFPVYLYLISMILNTIIHAIIDNAKANLLKINLIQDQSMHFLQILITWLIYILYIK